VPAEEIIFGRSSSIRCGSSFGFEGRIVAEAVSLYGTTVYRYSVFGGSLASTLDFPELPLVTAVGPVDFEFVEVDTLPAIDGWRLCGSSPVEDGVECRLHQSLDGSVFQLVFDDTGAFEVDRDGRRVRWCPPKAVDRVRARKDVLGRVFALLFHQQGIPTLHGSAVALDGSGLCFLAPKFHGKSTTAAALVDAGGTLLADDLVVVEPRGDGSTILRPTLPTLHLWPDSAERVGKEAALAPGQDEQVKVRIQWEPGAGLQAEPIPLRGIYLLAPVEGDEATVRRVPLEPGTAALALLGQMKIADLLGAAGVFELLPIASRLVDGVGVHRLEVPRDLNRLPELVECLVRWHAGEEAS
jgi:hypothetical protein